MELILNLLWLLLTVPALWLWREERRMRSGDAPHSWRFLMILACLLILLFPVISASDDLQALRVEAEEPATRDALRDSLSGRSWQAAHDGAHDFALPVAQFVASFGCAAWRAAVVSPMQIADSNVVLTRPGRAPPVFVG